MPYILFNIFYLFFILRRSPPIVLPSERMPWLLITDNVSDDDRNEENLEDKSGQEKENIFDDADDEWLLNATYDIL